MTKTAFISIIGCPNVGKSSILNRLLGQKVAIVSHRPQTTRTKIVGILTKGETQLVFTDTPGFHRPRTKLGEVMMKNVEESISGVDACLMVVEPQGEIRSAEKEMIGILKADKIPAILAINKIDLLKQKELLAERIAEFNALHDFSATVPVSAINGDNMEALEKELSALAKPSPHFFPEDALTDQPERVLAGEIIREKLLRNLDKEIPHGTAVVLEKMREREDSDLMDIDAVIYCEKESHKGIIIGKNGSMLKKVSTQAREDMEYFFQCRINLRCWVKVKDGWRNKSGLIHQFELD